MSVQESSFKAAMRMWASGVTVVTAAHGAEWQGMTVSSFASVSLQPALISVCLKQDAGTLALIEKAGRFGVSLLSSDQEAVSDHFATHGAEMDRFESQRIQTGESRIPLIEVALATLQCKVHSMTVVGDHTLVIGRVAKTDVGSGSPLVYFDGGYRTLRSA